MKVNLYKYLPYDCNLYLDVDAIALKDIQPMIDELSQSGKDYISHCVGYHTIDKGRDFKEMQWAKDQLAPGSTVLSDGLACFGAVAAADCTHRPTVVAGRKPKDLPEFKWVNTVIGNLKTSLSGSYHAFNFQKYAARYLAAFAYRFNRRFDLNTLQLRLLVAAVCCGPQPMRVIRMAEVHC